MINFLIFIWLSWTGIVMADVDAVSDERSIKHLQITIQQGKILWQSPHLGRIGKRCQQCHEKPVQGLDYPRYIASEQRVVPLRYMINRCLQKYALGSPLPENSPSLIALEAFLIHNPSKGLTTP